MITMDSRENSALAMFAPLWITGCQEKLDIRIYGISEAEAKDKLSDHWGITEKAGLIEQIVRMANANGHMEEYMELHNILFAMNEDEVTQYLHRVESESQRSLIIIVNTHKYELINCGGTAFDIVRGQFLASLGHEAGYLNEKEAWDYIYTCYDKYKDHFDSWEQYMLSYNVGRQFWMENLAEDYAHDQMYNRTAPLFFEKNSLFSKYAI